jgi:hypothetical protein
MGGFTAFIEGGEFFYDFAISLLAVNISEC